MVIFHSYVSLPEGISNSPSFFGLVIFVPQNPNKKNWFILGGISIFRGLKKSWSSHIMNQLIWLDITIVLSSNWRISWVGLFHLVLSQLTQQTGAHWTFREPQKNRTLSPKTAEPKPELGAVDGNPAWPGEDGISTMSTRVLSQTWDVFKHTLWLWLT